MIRRQHTVPMIVREGRAERLHHVGFSDRSFDESWLQKLLFDHPALLPVNEIEPVVFDGMIPVARELPTDAGSLDILFMNAQGFLTLVETKLWRNPEARRSVIAQIIDYVKEMARWSYRDLAEAVRKANGSAEPDPLLALLREVDSDLDEGAFHDAVSRNLRLGRFLLLIVGDGIREDVEHMAEFLQQAPQLGFTLGLVEIGLYRLKPDEKEPLFVQPRIVARTREVVRAVVEIRAGVNPADVRVTLPEPEKEGRTARRKITEEEFFENLARVAVPDAVELSRWVLENAEDHGLQIGWRDAGPVFQWTHDGTNHSFTFGQLHREGVLSSTERLPQKCGERGLPIEIWREYSDEIIRLVPGAFRKKAKHWELIGFKERGGKITDVPLALLWPCREQWFAAIDKAVGGIRQALDSEAAK